MLTLCLAVALVAAPEVKLVRQTRNLMSTEVSVTLVNASSDRAAIAFEAAFAEFERVAATMNEWKPDSPLSKINAAAGSGRPVASPAELCDVLERSLQAAKRTGGLFDPTWASLRELWRFGTAQTGTAPSAEAVHAACPLVAYEDVVVKRADAGAGCEVSLARAGMKLGLGGVAKGWAVDRAVARLRGLGFQDFLVQAGGDLYAAGTKGGEPWRVGIRDPRGPADRYFARTPLKDAALSTSGDYERFFIKDGRRYHHIIDPRTCYPATSSQSATVLAPTAVEAEFLTKAAFIAGGKSALELTDTWGAGAVLVDAHGEVHVSKSVAGRVELVAPDHVRNTQSR